MIYGCGIQEAKEMSAQWTPDMAVGVGVIDNQHKELFARFGKLLNAMSQGNGKDEMAATVKFLQDYVVTHFGTEETMMSRYAYPATAAHKAQHAEFVHDFMEVKRQLETSGAGPVAMIATMKQLGAWLPKHIGGKDKQFGAFLQTAMAQKAA
jgi:hemerythrin